MAEWKKIKIDKLCTIVKGQAGLAKATSGQYPLVTTGYKKKTCNEYQFNAKAVCIPLVSSTGHGKKTLNYVHYQEGKFALGTILAAVIPKDDEELDAKYLHLYLTFYKDRILVPLMRGAANVSLSIKDIKYIYIPVPSINIQKSIIAKYYKIKPASDELLEIINHQSKCFKQLRQVILQEAVEGKLTADWRKKNPELINGEKSAENLLKKIKIEKEQLIKEKKIKKQKPLPPISEEEKPFKLPKSWIWCRLGSFGFIQTGTTPPTSNKSNFGDFIPFITPEDISGKGINYKKRGLSKIGILKSRLIRNNSVLMVCIGGSIGKCYFTDKNVCCNQQINAVTPYYLSEKILFYMMISPLFQKQLSDKAMKSSTPILNKSKWENLLLPLPPFIEQQIIIKRLEDILNIIEQLEKQANQRKEQTAQLMYSVLREAFEQK